MTTFDFSRQVILNVTTTEDQNDGSTANGLSLRDAILQANANPSKEYIINVPAGTYNLTIKNLLTPPAIDEDENNRPDLDTLIESRKVTGDIDISGNITIIGEDPINTIISGAGLQQTFSAGITYRVGDRVLDIVPGSVLSLNNVTVQDGILVRDVGPIEVDIDGDGSIDGDVQVGNIDTNPYGAIINVATGANVTINNSIIANGESEERGAGISNSGTLTIIDSLIKNNQAKQINPDIRFTIPPFIIGGGIFNNGTLNIDRTAIINNTVTSVLPTRIEEGGGGIANDTTGTLTIFNSTISGNDVGLDVGGGILTKGRANIINSTITQNIAQAGGGVYSEGLSASTSLTNSIVAENKVTTELKQDVIRSFNQFNLRGETSVDFINEFVWDVVNGTNRLIEVPPDVTPFQDSFYNLTVLYRDSDPFSPFPTEGLDVTSSVRLDNLIFDSNGDIQFVFNSYFGEDLDNFFTGINGFSSEDNNLITNENQNFGFAYRDTSNNLVFLETEFEFINDSNGQGRLVLVLQDNNINQNPDFNAQIFVADKQETFSFNTFDNRLALDDDNKRQANFVRNEEDNTFYNFTDVVRFENRVVDTRTTTITNPTFVSDIDGFFAASSSFNLIGASTVNPIVDGVNNNIVGGVTTPVNPKLEAITDAQGNIIAYGLSEGSLALNSGNNAIVSLRQFFGNNPVDQFANPRINNGTVDIGSVEFGSSNTNNSDVNAVLNEGDSLLNSPIYRFQNRNVSGTYLYAGSQEAQNIRSNFPNFSEEGLAFKVSQVANDDLIPIYRFQNTSKPGTYLYAGTQERQSILTNNLNFKDEGIAFYVYGADANKGQDIYRLQNLNNPGTYLFVGETEKNNIIATNNNFRLEGVAFEVGI
ncbi:alkaline phosphatase [Geminocystis sp. NIES-3708]|uniref:choice-of-anchor Q domain-containing protein n=1 Tax=Geminocystis sp. NIES-3708 TaxID=1615909 RepID=UPI0005FC9DE5|nr:choice-of-anchor Q domain-containing protein [Geminocystis sp. NIES-3708]BAQ61688.1 alkaline phosphatase [Geminocystis sp. NIES-3708]